MIPIIVERKGQLEAYAHRRGQDTAVALDIVPAEYPASERRDFEGLAKGSRKYETSDPFTTVAFAARASISRHPHLRS